MEIQIISKQIVKPSTPTPHHLKTYKLSAYDQFAVVYYVPIILFYSPTSTDDVSRKNSDHLSESLSRTLTYFYPLAGRIKDGLSIDCNDDGATYIEAHVKVSMLVILEQPDKHELEQLLPCKLDEHLHDLSTRVMLAAQVNYFDCGGIALAVCISHLIADASTITSFLKSWGSISYGPDDNDLDFDGVVVDWTSLFPPQNLSDVIGSPPIPLKPENARKRFLFDGPKLAALKEKISKGPYLDRATRVEAVSALIWGAVIGEENESKMSNSFAVHAVELRRRMDPPLPPQSIGNICHLALVNWPAQVVDYNGLAAKLHESIRMVTNDYVKKVHADGYYPDLQRQRVAEIGKDPNTGKILSFSSWCKFPIYEIDFGWGKPTLVCPPLKSFENIVVLLDARDGEGIEAWVTLPVEEMVKFEQNRDILAFASFSPS